MHKLRHHSLAKKLHLNSLLLIAGVGFLISLLGLLIATVITQNMSLAIGAGVALVGIMFLALLNFMIGARCRCQLCQSPMMAPRKCSRHRKAKRLFRSYRLKLATSFLFSESFTCPFCGESFSSHVVEREQPGELDQPQRSTRPIRNARTPEPRRNKTS